MLVERNQMPITKPAARSGASLVMALRPTGLRESSPKVCRKYVPISHHIATCAPPDDHVRRRHQNRERQAGPNKAERELGRARWLRRRRFSASHSQAKTGASATTKIGCTNWNQPAGNSQPNNHAVGVALGEQVQGRAGLFERRPEQRRGDETAPGWRPNACAPPATIRAKRSSTQIPPTKCPAGTSPGRRRSSVALKRIAPAAAASIPTARRHPARRHRRAGVALLPPVQLGIARAGRAQAGRRPGCLAARRY